MRVRGRWGYSLAALWRAHLARFLLNLPSMNATIRRLQEDPALRGVCGFTATLPHRTTFNRFAARLSEHQDLVDEALATLTDQLQQALPGFGEKVAVDGAVIRAYSNPDRALRSDPDASWTAKSHPQPKGGREWFFGYKEHALVDATYGIPIVRFATMASRTDFHELPNLMNKAAMTHQWFAPTHVIADQGYVSEANHRAIMARGAVPVIPIRRVPAIRRQGICGDYGTPTCFGNIPMEYLRSDPERGHLYRCRSEGCNLRDRSGVAHCRDQLWEKRPDNPRLAGPISRDSIEWRDLYGLRQAIERMFKSLKQSRSLQAHCVRGLRRVGLHAAMSVLAFQATALFRL